MGDIADLDDWYPGDEDVEDAIIVSGAVKHTTEKAILLNLGAGRGEIWLPKSQLDGQNFDDRIGETVEIIVPGWLARANGLEEE